MMTVARSKRAAFALAALLPLALADLPTRASANPLAPIWTGVYIGAQGGVNWADLDAGAASSLSSTAFSGGGHIGYNLEFGSIVLGVEADANFDNSSFTFAAPSGTGAYDVDWNGSLRARAGYSFGPALFYATAGYAWSNASLLETSAAGASYSATHHFDGVVYGAGVESFVLPNLSLRLEALRYDYGADKLSLSGAANSIQEFDPSDTVVRAGVTFHLN
jgi:outer membrane immunogenic protein